MKCIKITIFINQSNMKRGNYGTNFWQMKKMVYSFLQWNTPGWWIYYWVLYILSFQWIHVISHKTLHLIWDRKENVLFYGHGILRKILLAGVYRVMWYQGFIIFFILSFTAETMIWERFNRYFNYICILISN